MLATFTLLIIFGILPALSGYIANVCGSLEKRTWYHQKAQDVKGWTASEYSLAAFITSTTLLYAVGFFTLIGMKPGLMTGVGLLLLSCLSALAYLCCYWKIPAIVAKYGGLLKVVLGAVAIGVATLSKIYSDAGIAELTSLSPQDLPGAQLLLTFLLTPTIWFLGLSLTLGYLSLPVLAILFLRSLYRDFRKIKDGKKNESNLRDVTALVAVFFSVIILLSITEKIASKRFYEPRLKQTIVFASFHLPTSYCGLIDAKGVQIAPMSDGRAAIAIPDGKLDYTFDIIDCKPQKKDSDQVNAILEKSNSEKMQ
ncbi:hypothetical protein PspCFBP13506_24050 [Pseudomonas sp. CFBP13506]|uniref:hypothetical protein n=1 Tax=Pseudomonas sp. CFBP13506 TaxID=2184010 RepID=UPI0010C02216|nr:hypothetical protein [Pseudomonas sp. CFBP13506]TKJ57645.1 hypothetical protein PspCFBP13506_24050 [Pseudomonas sp. CFBP13506]